jgi:hypothetical protein
MKNEGPPPCGKYMAGMRVGAGELVMGESKMGYGSI